MSPRKRKLVIPNIEDIKTEEEAKLLISIGRGWLWAHKMGVQIGKQASIWGPIVGLVIGTAQYFLSDKSSITFPEPTGAVLSLHGTAYAGDRQVEYDTSLVFRRVKGTNMIHVTNRNFPDHPPLTVTVESLEKLDKYYEGLEKRK